MITDSEGYEIIKILNLPYSDVSIALNDLAGENHKLWVLGKFKAFKKQTKSFIHIDNDVYLWNKLVFASNTKYLIAQSRIQISEIYKQTLKEVFEKFTYVPPCIEKRKIPKKFLVANAGIIGGSDIDFF